MEPWVFLAILICPIVMGGMMLWMMRQMRGRSSRDDDGPGADE